MPVVNKSAMSSLFAKRSRNKMLSVDCDFPVAFAPVPVTLTNFRRTLFIPVCKRPYRRQSVSTRSAQYPAMCENLGYEDETAPVLQYNGRLWDFEINEEDIILEADFTNPSRPNINQICLVGRLGADPTFKTVRSGSELCTFSMAVADDYDPIDNDEDTTSWFDVEIWGVQARLASRAKKGMRVGVTGSLGMNCWTGRDNIERNDPIVRAQSFELLQSRSESNPNTSSQYSSTEKKESESNPNTSSLYSSTEKKEQKAPVSTPQNSEFQVDGNLRDLPF